MKNKEKITKINNHINEAKKMLESYNSGGDIHADLWNKDETEEEIASCRYHLENLIVCLEALEPKI